MKTIGLIGGMGWESTKVYYEYINQLTNRALGGSHSAKIIMVSVEFSEIERLSHANDWNAVGTIMADAAITLEKAGADVILLCTNTIHMVSKAIIASVNIPFLHIAEATGAAIQEQSLKKIALLGTRFTMEKDFYTKTLEERYGLEVIVPEATERQQIHNIIYHELIQGKFTEKSKAYILEIIHKLKSEAIDGVILGCTELPLLISESELDIPSFNTTLIHAQKAVDFALEQKEIFS
ncbi:aspartate/glutamate racemase family protein [Spongiimicrobium salis]|uniref:aspartate/glutamate racemase family protein n=1 Tax=Spongiimicrobium salis TaxID=1667022 RepID=UPI00374C9B88